MKMKKKLFLLTALMAAAGIYAQNNNVIDEIAWIVGDEAIFKSDIENTRISAQMQGVRWDGDPYCIIPEELAIQKLYLNQAELDSIYASDDEVNNQIDYTIQMLTNEYGSTEKLEEYRGMKLSEIRAHMEDDIRNQLVVHKMQSKITEKVKVTPAEVRRYLKNVEPDQIPFVPTKVEVQIITREPKIPQEEIDAVKAELRDYTERIQSGQTQFSTLALLYSEDPVSARRGGELGFFGRGEMVPEFSTVAFNLTDPTKVSKIVESEYGFHIIQLIEKRGDRMNARHILRKPKVSDEAINACLLQLDTIAGDIREEKFSFDEAAGYLSYDKDTRNNKGLMTYHPENANTSVSKFEMQQLPSEVARVINNMHVGEISDPFTMVNDKGKTVCAIVKLKSRTNGHKATMTDDYQVLQEQFLSEKQDEVLKKWVAEKQKTTYIKIFEGWGGCEFRYPGWNIQ